MTPKPAGDSGRAARASYYRYGGLGIEMAAAVGLCVAGGVWLDGRYDTSPWWLLAGLAVGLAAGVYRLIAAVRSASEKTGGGSNPDRFT